MEAIAKLVEEHHLILRFLDLLDQAAKQIVAGVLPRARFFEQSLTFARQFADTYHHYKEEHVLFGFLAQCHAGRIDAQVEAQRQQHEQLRNMLQDISGKLDAYAANRQSVAREIHRSISDYSYLLREHIRAENEIFFPLVMETLTEADMALLFDSFCDYEAKAVEWDLASYRHQVDEIEATLHSD